MKIRTKLLILLLSIALIPLILSTVFHSFSALQLSHDLTDDTREQLSKNAYTLLHTLVDEYGQILKRDEAQILLALHLQAKEVEKLLASRRGAKQPLYFSADYAQPARQPAGLSLSNKHFRHTPEGDLAPIPVTYQTQVIFLPAGVNAAAVADDLDRFFRSDRNSVV